MDANPILDFGAAQLPPLTGYPTAAQPTLPWVGRPIEDADRPRSIDGARLRLAA